MTTIREKSQAKEITTLLQEFHERYATTAVNRPEKPDTSLGATLFSAYDAAEAALGRMLELGIEQDTCRTPQQSQTNPTASEMAQDLGDISDRIESLLETVTHESDPDSHVTMEAALGRLQDASDLLSSRTLPSDNPAPYCLSYSPDTSHVR